MNQRDRKRPRVVINAAMSVDGKSSRTERGHLPISDEADLAPVDRLRSEVAAIVTGGGALRSDKPGLTIRSAAVWKRRKRLPTSSRQSSTVIRAMVEARSSARFIRAAPGGFTGAVRAGARTGQSSFFDRQQIGRACVRNPVTL